MKIILETKRLLLREMTDDDFVEAALEDARAQGYEVQEVIKWLLI